MNRLYSFPNRGFVIEANSVRAGLDSDLRRSGLAHAAVRTLDGIYVEPATALQPVLEAVAASGTRIRNVRACGTGPEWHQSARPAAKARLRLTNPLSPGWLPTFPAA